MSSVGIERSPCCPLSGKRCTKDSLYVEADIYSTVIAGILYVVDSTDRERFSESRDELQRMLKDDEMRGVPVVVLANKQDLPGQ